MPITIFNDEIDFWLGDIHFRLTRRGVYTNPLYIIYPERVNKEQFESVYELAKRIQVAWNATETLGRWMDGWGELKTKAEFAAFIKQHERIVYSTREVIKEIEAPGDDWLGEPHHYREFKQALDEFIALRKGYVYLLKTNAGYWKIGHTNNPKDRLRTFGIKLPFEVEYDHLIPCLDRLHAERELHVRYAALRVNGSEFFALTPADVAEIKAIKEL